MSRTITYREALNEALAEEMRRDQSVFVYGIDVGDHKRIFNSTKGLVEEFGPARCFSTPLAEDAMTGFGLGAAINGMRPVHVHMRMDFLMLGINQLVNMIATHCYGSGGTMKPPTPRIGSAMKAAISPVVEVIINSSMSSAQASPHSG